MKKHPLSLALAILAAACSVQHTPDGASLKIDSGWFVGEGGTDDNTVPGVMAIEGCTATAVSDNTLLFAGHCVSQSGGGSADGKMPHRTCIGSGTLSKGACSDNVWVPPSWNDSQDFHQDVAVAIYPRGTFKRYFEVNETPVKVGDKIVLVGYSQHNLDDQSKGSKRWGYNSISEFDEQNVIISRYTNAGAGVAVSPGDSGGPVMKDCKVSGVASRMSEEATKLSLHTNITDRDNIAWLKSLRAQGAEFCGLSDAKGDFCDTKNRAQPRQVAQGSGQPAFPCTETGTAGSGGTQPSGSVFLAVDASDYLHVSAPLEADKVFVCFDKAPSACTADEASTSLERSTADRKILKTGAFAAARRVAVVVKDKNGKDLATLAADIKSR